MEFREIFIELARRAGKLKFLAKGGKLSKEFLDSIKFLGWSIEPREIIALSRISILLTFFTLLLLIAYLSSSGIPIGIPLILTFTVPFLIAHLITEYSKNLTNFERLKALSHAPSLLPWDSLSPSDNLPTSNPCTAWRWGFKFSSDRITPLYLSTLDLPILKLGVEEKTTNFFFPRAPTNQRKILSPLLHRHFYSDRSPWIDLLAWLDPWSNACSSPRI